MADEPTKTDAQTPLPPPDPIPPVQVQAAPEPVKGTKCPACKGALDVYSGENPSKASTGFCSSCGVRYPLKG